MLLSLAAMKRISAPQCPKTGVLTPRPSSLRRRGCWGRSTSLETWLSPLCFSLTKSRYGKLFTAPLILNNNVCFIFRAGYIWFNTCTERKVCFEVPCRQAAAGGGDVRRCPRWVPGPHYVHSDGGPRSAALVKRDRRPLNHSKTSTQVSYFWPGLFDWWKSCA